MSIGYFQWTKIGCFRWTRSGCFRRTLTLDFLQMFRWTWTYHDAPSGDQLSGNHAEMWP